MLKTFERSVRKLYYQFYNEREFVKNNLEAFEKQLDFALEQSNVALDSFGDDSSIWGEAIGEVYAVDETVLNFFQRFELKIMKWYVNNKYAKALDGLVKIGICKEEILYMKNQIMILKAWR